MCINLLIVDDEYYCVENLKMKIEKRSKEFQTIFCAYSLKQALEYISSKNISIMICDIEMPGGSGLELLNCIRNKKLNTICIFLTAYAKFEYVSQALKLSSLDYLLKPVEDEQLFSALDRALSQYRQQQQSLLNTIHADYWKENRLYLLELFWMDLLENTISDKHDGILQELSFRKLDPALAEVPYYLIFLQICHSQKPFSTDESIIDFTLKNILREYFYEAEEAPIAIRISADLYVLALPTSRHSFNALISSCENALVGFLRHFKASFNFFVTGEAIFMEEAPAVFAEIRSLSTQNVVLENYVFDLSRPFTEYFTKAVPEFPQKEWNTLLLNKNTQKLGHEAITYLKGLKYAGTGTRETLTSFYYGFLQLLFLHLENHTALHHFQKYLASQSADLVCSSFDSMSKWIPEILASYESCLNRAQEQSDVVFIVQQYIHKHLGEDITRYSLAEIVHLSPDYLSHLFKQKTGFSLTNYIIEERIRESKRLLSDKKISIRDIAITCGFQNVSYFSRQFKKSTGMTPREFRRL